MRGGQGRQLLFHLIQVFGRHPARSHRPGSQTAVPSSATICANHLPQLRQLSGSGRLRGMALEVILLLLTS